jgi:hypothetical protein
VLLRDVKRSLAVVVAQWCRRGFWTTDYPLIAMYSTVCLGVGRGGDPLDPFGVLHVVIQV